MLLLLFFHARLRGQITRLLNMLFKYLLTMITSNLSLTVALFVVEQFWGRTYLLAASDSTGYSSAWLKAIPYRFCMLLAGYPLVIIMQSVLFDLYHPKFCKGHPAFLDFPFTMCSFPCNCCCCCRRCQLLLENS